MSVWRIAVLAAAVIVCPPQAGAQSSRPAVATCDYAAGIQFPSTGAYDVDVTLGGRVLTFSGPIKAGEGARLQQALQTNAPIDEVWLHSPGGAAIEGFNMGRVLRRAGALVRIPDAAMCFSACSTAFLGGAIRVVDPRGQYGVHMFTTANANTVVDELAGRMQGGRESARDVMRDMERSSAVMATQQSRYIVEMGVSMRLAELMSRQSSKGMRCLNRRELVELNVVNLAE